MGVTSDLSLKDLLEDFGMRETSNLSLKDLLEDFGMRETSNLSLKELLEDFGMRGTSNLSPKDLLEDFGVWAMRVPNVRVIFENLSILQACRGLEVNVVRYLLALPSMVVEQEQQDRNLRPRVGAGGDEDPALRGPSGPPVVYGPSISATQCETRGGDPHDEIVGQLGIS